MKDMFSCDDVCVMVMFQMDSVKYNFTLITNKFLLRASLFLSFNVEFCIKMRHGTCHKILSEKERGKEDESN